MSLFKGKDTISGKEGKAFTTIDGIVEEMFYVKTLESTLNKNKSVVRAVGSRADHHKTTGFGGTGSLTIHYMTTKFRQLVRTYVKTGVDTYFDIQIVNEDPSSSAGKQTIVLKNCNLDAVMLGKLDADTDDALDESFDFTFEDFDILDDFTSITV